MQCSTEPPELTEEARRGLPRGVEALLFDLLEKAAGDRPASASVVVERLAHDGGIDGDADPGQIVGNQARVDGREAFDLSAEGPFLAPPFQRQAT